jgi:hypothetical protein
VKAAGTSWRMLKGRGWINMVRIIK